MSRDYTVFVVGLVVAVMAIVTAIAMHTIEQRIIDREHLRPWLEEISASMPGFRDEVDFHNRRHQEAMHRLRIYRTVRIGAFITAFVATMTAIMGYLFR